MLTITVKAFFSVKYCFICSNVKVVDSTRDVMSTNITAVFCCFSAPSLKCAKHSANPLKAIAGLFYSELNSKYL